MEWRSRGVMGDEKVHRLCRIRRHADKLLGLTYGC